MCVKLQEYSNLNDYKEFDAELETVYGPVNRNVNVIGSRERCYRIIKI